MLDLPGVTLCCIDTANPALALRAIERSREGVRYARALFVTASGVRAPDGIDVVPIAPLASRDDYSRFVLKSLRALVETPHVLLIQWDGYVVNPEAWEPAFLDCDYIGAKWFWHDDGMRVGNGGFSLRSRRLLDALQDARIELVEAEDITIGRAFRPLLEREHGIRFATEDVADRFAFEAAYPIGRPFGFHGLFNFCRVVPPAELAALASSFSDAIARSPQLLALARNCVALGQWQAAIAIAQRMLTASPDDAEASALLAAAEQNARAHVGVGRNDPCPCGSGKRFKQCHGAIGASPPVPPSADALVRDAVAAHQRGALDDAERGYRAALAASPDHAVATHYLGVVLMQRQKLDEALPLLERAVRDAPGEPEFHNNLGLALGAADRCEEAVAAFRRALDLKPDHAVAWNNLGLALHALNRMPQAIDAYRRALAHAPSFEQARWNLALSLLANGEYAEGWKAYDARLALGELGAHGFRSPMPRWDGAVRGGTTLLLDAEQGLGDAIQFVRFARPLADKGLRVVVRAPHTLVRLLAGAHGVAQTIAFDDPLPPHDTWLPLPSVAGVLGVDAASIPARVPYIAVDAKRREDASRAVARASGRLRVGVAWAGSAAHVNDRRRSIPLATLAELFAIPDVAWFSLQKGDAAAQLASVPSARALVPLPDSYEMDDTAALVDALDVVLAVDTSVAHLAGALAKPAWVMLPFSGDWRWGVAGERNAWYPTMRLFRQPAIGDWTSVVRAVARALAEGQRGLR